LKVKPTHTYPFFKEENKERLNKCVWIVEFDGVTGVSEDGEYVQGSAFMVGGDRLLSAHHIFIMAGDVTECIVRRIEPGSKRYKASIFRTDIHRDLVELKISEVVDEIFSFLEVLEVDSINEGYEVAVVGFPQLQLGHHGVAIKVCTVIRSLKRQALLFKEVDQNIQSGCSGGPVVDGYMRVVGMAQQGETVSTELEIPKVKIIAQDDEEYIKFIATGSKFSQWLRNVLVEFLFGKNFGVKTYEVESPKKPKVASALQGSNLFLSSTEFYKGS